jgi:phosphocarrier protein HPr
VPVVIERELPIVNRLGLHARAAARLVQAAGAFQSEIHVSHRGREVNAKSIMGLMMLAATCGSTLRLVADGPDELAAADAIAALVANRFGEAA